jgi:GDP-4-dehydro-6-deoxy-D-mannose reductase
MNGPILVTGAAGFAGSHLLERLRAEGGPGVAIAAWRHGKSRPVPAVPGIGWRAVDVLDRHAVFDEVARTRPAVVYHCAGAAHVGRAWDRTEATLAVNARGTHHLVSALETLGTPVRVVIPSSALVYRPSDAAIGEEQPLVPAGPYGLSKLAQELVAEHAMGGGLDVILARAFNHVGPRQDPSFSASGFARQIADIEAGRQPPVIEVGNLEARRDITDVRDTVRAYVAMAGRGVAGRAYNVCSGRALAISEILDMLRALARVPVAVRVDPARLRPVDVPLLLGDPSRAARELGWRADIPIGRTLSDLLDYWRSCPR